jgi:Cytochrome c554 and c-prime
MRCVLVGKRAIRSCVLAAAGFLAVGLGSFPWRPADAAPPPVSVHAATDNAGFAAWRGVSSCTSSACHNQPAERGGEPLKGREYGVWLAKDPHARAYQHLFDKKSLSIQNQLHQSSPEKEPLAAVSNRLCLRCHVAPEAENVADSAPVWFSDGVGCESCHGSSGRWLSAHTGPGWRRTSAEEKMDRGFHETKNLAVRAETCMACHVGGERAEVNHDLLAAGHPPLQFEFSSFLDRYRAYQHWSEADDRRRDPAYEADAWAVGQAASARAALKLLAARAGEVANARAQKRADPKPWPEFAEYACSSCHHGLEQRRPVAPGRKSGAPAWSGYATLTPLLPAFGESRPDTLVQALRDEMETRNPGPAKVVDKAQALTQVYDDWLNRRPAHVRLDAGALRGRLSLLSGAEGEAVVHGGWEDARQLSFAISAHSRSLEAVDPDPRTADAVRRLVDDLRLPCGQDTPRKYDAEEAIKDLRDLYDRLNNR